MTRRPDPAAILAAVRDALRAVQHGAADPDLARALADACDRALGSSGPSLTPNEDASWAAMAAEPDRAAMAEPGDLGVIARMQIPMRRARALAVARELDRATPATAIVPAFVHATATEIFVVARALLVGRAERLLLGAVARDLDRVAANYEAGAIGAVYVQHTRVPTA